LEFIGFSALIFNVESSLLKLEAGMKSCWFAAASDVAFTPKLCIHARCLDRDFWDLGIGRIFFVVFSLVLKTVWTFFVAIRYSTVPDTRVRDVALLHLRFCPGVSFCPKLCVHAGCLDRDFWDLGIGRIFFVVFSLVLKTVWTFGIRYSTVPDTRVRDVALLHLRFCPGVSFCPQLCVHARCLDRDFWDLGIGRIFFVVFSLVLKTVWTFGIRYSTVPDTRVRDVALLHLRFCPGVSFCPQLCVHARCLDRDFWDLGIGRIFFVVFSLVLKTVWTFGIRYSTVPDTRVRDVALLHLRFCPGVSFCPKLCVHARCLDRDFRDLGIGRIFLFFP
jgi:hypothetical protein